ncbi:MAG TPA: hypothetical protein VE981_13035 [Planctomycetota bacterium]|nr:hypothetical protein [Planctomycetota bacterium]
MPAGRNGLPPEPSGAGNGRFTAFRELTAAAALPGFDLIVATDINGNAVVVWRQGKDHIVPLGGSFGSLYSTGGTFNLSNTPAVGSHGPIFALLTDAGPGYVSRLEAVTSGPDTHDLYFALKP